MRTMRASAVSLLVILLASTLPVAAQEGAGINNPNVSTPTTLFMHLNGFQDFPINTQIPSDEYSASEGIGLQTHSLSCLPDTGTGSLASKAWHTYYGYSSPGYVEYNFEQDGKPRYHPERGISFDAKLDTSAPFDLFWYIETQTGVTSAGLPADPNSAPVPLHNVIVKATIRTGDAISVGDDAYNVGEIIAQGQSEPATLAADATTGAVYYSDTGRPVYGFQVPMSISMDKIPRDTGYNLRVDVYMDNPACSGQPEDGYVMPNAIKLHTSPGHRPRMELSVMNPIRIEYVHPQFVGDDLVVHTSANSPWGNYDVAETEGFFATPGGIELTIEGPTTPRSLQQVAFTQRHHEHDHHQEAVDISYLWPYKQDAAANGLYTVTFKVQNDQQTATAIGTAQFEIGKGTVIGCGGVTEAQSAGTDCKEEVQPDGKPPTKDSPGAGLLAILGLLGVAGFLARRRA